MPSADPGESGLAPVYGMYVGRRTPPTLTTAPGMDAATPAVGAAAAPLAAVVAWGAAVGFTLTLAAVGAAVAAGLGGVVGAAVGAGAALGAVHAARSGTATEPSISLPSSVRREVRTILIAAIL